VLAEGESAGETLAHDICFYAGIGACEKRAQCEVASSMLREMPQ
jgi:hypothetical protein